MKLFMNKNEKYEEPEVHMADHFVNNTIVNLLHIESSTGTDEMMFLRITVAQTISFLIVLFIFLERKNHGKKGIINKTISE